MSQTLDLVTGLLAAARRLQDLGHSRPALHLLQRLAVFRQLPPATAEEVHSRLAELYGGREEFKPARRHLTIALTYRPQHAAYHHRMARLIEDDSDASIDRAGRYHRRAVRGEPDNAAYWAAYGEFLLGAGRTRAGRHALRRAFRLAHFDVALVGEVAAILRVVDLWADARKILRRALFLNARDRRFRQLWQRHQFAEVHHNQQRSEPRVDRATGLPNLLPFLRTADAPRLVQSEGKILRLDRGDEASVLPLPKRQPRAAQPRGELTPSERRVRGGFGYGCPQTTPDPNPPRIETPLPARRGTDNSAVGPPGNPCTPGGRPIKKELAKPPAASAVGGRDSPIAQW